VDDNGLVEGKWDGSFEDGTSPFAWIGSTPIFEEFYNTQQPVKYGQCWVFSGVIVTSECYTRIRKIFATTVYIQIRVQESLSNGCNNASETMKVMYLFCLTKTPCDRN